MLIYFWQLIDHRVCTSYVFVHEPMCVYVYTSLLPSSSSRSPTTSKLCGAFGDTVALRPFVIVSLRPSYTLHALILLAGRSSGVSRGWLIWPTGALTNPLCFPSFPRAQNLRSPSKISRFSARFSRRPGCLYGFL